MTVFTLLRMIYVGCLIVTAFIGLRLGGRSERVGTFIVLAASAATVAVEHALLFDWSRDRSGLIAVDVIVLLALLHLALTSRRFWPLWATAFHLIALCSHCVVLLDPNRILQVYAFLQGFWAYPIMLVIILGALSRQRRLVTGRTAFR